MAQRLYILVIFPAQGHINPGLQFAKRVVGAGADVTFVTTVFAHRGMMKNNDGYDEGFKPGIRRWRAWSATGGGSSDNNFKAFLDEINIADA